MPDKNYLSYTSPDHDGTDQYFVQEIDGTGYSDTIKLSNWLQNCRIVVRNVLIGGSEDCVDMNRTRNCSVVADQLRSGGKFVATIKGGSTGWMLKGEVVKHGSEVDVDLGNWSDQSSAETGAGTLDLTSADGKPITVRVLNSRIPNFASGSGPYRYVFPSPKLGPLHSLIVKGFLLLRRIGFFK